VGQLSIISSVDPVYFSLAKIEKKTVKLCAISHRVFGLPFLKMYSYIVLVVK